MPCLGLSVSHCRNPLSAGWLSGCCRALAPGREPQAEARRETDTEPGLCCIAAGAGLPRVSMRAERLLSGARGGLRSILAAGRGGREFDIVMHLYSDNESHCAARPHLEL